MCCEISVSVALFKVCIQLIISGHRKLTQVLKLYIKHCYRLFIFCLVFKIFRPKRVSCSPSWIIEDIDLLIKLNFYILFFRIINQYKLSKGDWDRRITELWTRHGEMHRYRFIDRFIAELKF